MEAVSQLLPLHSQDYRFNPCFASYILIVITSRKFDPSSFSEDFMVIREQCYSVENSGNILMEVRVDYFMAYITKG